MPRRAQPTVVAAPDVGLVANLPPHAIPDHAATAAMNVWFRAGRMEKVSGFSQVGGQLDGPVIGLYDFRTSQGDQFWLAATETTLYYYDAVSGAWAALATGLSGVRSIPADFAQFRDIALFTNGTDPIKKITVGPGGSLQAANLGGSPPRCKRIAVFQGHAVAINITNDGSGVARPNTIMWSDVGDIEVWNAGDAGTMAFDDEAGELMDGETLVDSLIVGKSSAIYAVEYTVAPFTMTRRRLTTGTGFISPRAVTAVRDALFYISGVDRQIHRLTPAGALPVGDAVRDRLFAELDFQASRYVFAVPVIRDQSVLFGIPLAGDSVGVQIAYILNYAEGRPRWGRRELTAEGSLALSAAEAALLSDLRWDDVNSTWDSQVLSWDEAQTLRGAPILLHGTVSGKVYQHRLTDRNAGTSPIIGVVDTKLYDFGDPMAFKRLTRLGVSVEQQGAYDLQVYVGTADAPGMAITWQGPYTIKMDGSSPPWIDVDLTARLFAFRFRTDGIDQPFAVLGYEPTVYMRGVR